MNRKTMLGAALAIAFVLTIIALFLVERPATHVAERIEAAGERHNGPAPSAQVDAGDGSLSQATQVGATANTGIAKTLHSDSTGLPHHPHRRGVPNGYSELPAERIFLLNGRMDVDAVRTAIRSDDFDDVLDRLEQQAQTDVLAMEMNQLYRTTLQQQALNYDLNPGRVACGIRFCTGSIMSSDPAAWERLVDALTGSDDFPLYMFGSHDRQLDPALTEHRFFFSIDPEIQAATGVLPRYP